MYFRNRCLKFCAVTDYRSDQGNKLATSHNIRRKNKNFNKNLAAYATNKCLDGIFYIFLFIEINIECQLNKI